jgi:hypothetical protein
MTNERESHCDGCRDDWSFHMRRCPCGGVVDDELLVPQCCKCRRELDHQLDGEWVPGWYVAQEMGKGGGHRRLV